MHFQNKAFVDKYVYHISQTEETALLFPARPTSKKYKGKMKTASKGLRVESEEHLLITLS